MEAPKLDLEYIFLTIWLLHICHTTNPDQDVEPYITTVPEVTPTFWRLYLAQAISHAVLNDIKYMFSSIILVFYSSVNKKYLPFVVSSFRHACYAHVLIYTMNVQMLHLL